MTAPVRIAVIGIGLIGPRHARTVVEDPDAKLVAIVDPVPHSEGLARELGVPHYKSVADLITSVDKPDGAIICTPNATHVNIGLELVAGNIDILVEKPVSIDLQTGNCLIRQARARGVKILVGHHRRFNSYIVKAKEIVDSGSLGEITAITGTWAVQKPPQYFDPPTEWRRYKTAGTILINMVHEVDLLRELLGPITRVYAEKAPSRRGFEAEEGAAITLRFGSGAIGTFLLLDNVPSPHCFEAGTGENPLIPETGRDFYRIFGSDAMLSVPDMMRWSYDGRPKDWGEVLVATQTPVTSEIPFKQQLAHFVKVIRRVEEPKCSGEDGLAALAVCEALKKSLDTGVPVIVETSLAFDETEI